MGIIKSAREADLERAGEYRKTVAECLQENGIVPNALAEQLRYLLEQAELLERKHGAPHPTMNVSAAHGDAFKTQRVMDLERARELRGSVAQMEKDDPSAVSANRPFFQRMVDEADRLEKTHGVGSGATTTATMSAQPATARKQSVHLNVASEIRSVRFNPETDNTPEGRKRVIEAAIEQGRIYPYRVYSGKEAWTDIWNRRFVLDPLSTIIALNDTCPGDPVLALQFFKGRGQTPTLRADDALRVAWFSEQEGRIFANQTAHWTKALQTDTESALIALADLAPGGQGTMMIAVEPGGQFATNSAGVRGSDGLTETERGVCAQLGISPGDFLAAKGG